METLYKEQYEWSIFYFNNLDGTYSVVTKHGTTGGKLVEHTTIIKEGKNIGKKNETTIEEQAILEAQREWEKKQKQGYHVKNETKEVIKPMLAQEYKKIVQFPAWVQPKLDGVRCLVYMEQGKVVFQSRQNNRYEPLAHLVDDLEEILKRSPGIVLDGELYAHDIGFENVISMIRRAKVRHPDIQKIKYHVYDLFYKDKGMTYDIRRNLLDGLYKDELNVVVVQTIQISNINEIDDLLHKYMFLHYEGIMIRGNGKYKHGRSKDLLKYKIFKDDEFEVIGHHEGNGGIPIFECKTGNKTFSVAMKGTMESKINRMDQVTSYYGKMLTVKYQELSLEGIPRFPVGIAFRDYE